MRRTPLTTTPRRQLYDSIWSHHDYVCRSFCCCLSCFYVFSCFMFYWRFVWLCFFQWHFIDLFSCIVASLFNKLTYLLTSAKVKLKNPMPCFFSETQCRKKTLKQPVAKDGVVLGESNGACSSRVLEWQQITDFVNHFQRLTTTHKHTYTRPSAFSRIA